MYVVKVLKKNAEKVKQLLRKTQNLSHQYKIIAKNEYVYFPIISKITIPKKYSVLAAKLPKLVKKETNLKKNLSNYLTPAELKKLKTAFDRIGTIAILEIDEEFEKKEKYIGKALLKLVPSLKTVLKKEGHHEGEFRTQRMKFLAGVDTRETVHRENGVSLVLDVEKVYFSPRLSNERKRIFQQVKKGERVLVMFSGCAPYPCVLAKNSLAKEIYGVEMNTIAHQYAIKNVQVNKLKNVFPYEGDVRSVVPKLKKKFDRIIMPLPKSAEDFLDIALSVAENGAIIHFYDFLHEDFFADAWKKIKKACVLAKKQCKILRTVRCGQYSPRTYRICVDFVVQ